MSSSSPFSSASPIAEPEQANQPQPLITIHYGGEKATIHRITDYKFKSLANVDPGKLRFEGRIEGYADNREIDDELWPSVAHTLSEASLCAVDKNGPTSAPSREFGSQTSITVEAAGQEYQLEVNLIGSRIIDVKKMMQEKLGIPVERLHLIIPDEDPDEYPWPVDNEVLAAAGVTRGSQAGASKSLPLIVATFREESVAIPRSDKLYGRSIASIEDSLVSAFPALQERGDILVKAKAPGMEKPIKVLPALWPQIWSIVTDILVEAPPTEDERRLEMMTEVGTSKLTVRTPTETYNLKINLLCATARNLKMLLEAYTGVAVERQILQFATLGSIPDPEYPADPKKRVDRLYREVEEDDVLYNCHVHPNENLRLVLRSKETPVQDVVVKVG
ncbi:hypothetical protein PENSPDRAFT_671751 [Peniophora sp. CONT]|nr:hypothetical protein PENSPDRAFT_671751 [Peniophora sp. CONT]